VLPGLVRPPFADVADIELVVNYDLPDDPEDYVHRIGRTGRAGQDGRAITLATPDQGLQVRLIERVMRAPIPRVEHAEVPTEHFTRVAGVTARPQGARGQQSGRGPRPAARSRRPSAGRPPRGVTLRFRPRHRRWRG
jgi:superfamily II DNA/RNA helicase